MVRSNFHGSRGKNIMQWATDLLGQGLWFSAVIFPSIHSSGHHSGHDSWNSKVEEKSSTSYLLLFLYFCWTAFVSILCLPSMRAFFGVNCFLTRFSSYRISVISVTICQLWFLDNIENTFLLVFFRSFGHYFAPKITKKPHIIAKFYERNFALRFWSA